jgi:hypothetical protein
MDGDYDPQAEMEVIHKQVGGWFDEFVGTPRYQALTEVQKDKAPGIVRFFTEYSFLHIGATPEKWNQDVLRECCLEILPRKMSAERAFFQAIAPVLSAFFRFLAERGFLTQARELVEAVVELDDEIIAASEDIRNWGPAKAFHMAALEAGVNTCDQKAMNLFMVEHNLRQLAQIKARQSAPRPPMPSRATSATPVHQSAPKVGRNDPCPCGSGKKFKKCCGA